MKRVEADKLVDKYLAGKCTPEERAIVEQAYNMTLASEDMGISPAETKRMKTYVRAKIMEAKVVRVPRRRMSQRWVYSAAAILLTMFTVGAYFLMGENTPMEPVEIHAESVMPGSNRAKLTLGDGRIIELSEAQSGIVIGETHITYPDGSDVDHIATGTQRPTTDYFVLRTPPGGTYQVTLPDSSMVWLNAATTLKYPAHFSNTERLVELDGEAYFSVKKDPLRSFRVVSGMQEVEVLGTEFNVFAYQDGDVTTTTLVNGSVKILNPKSKIVTQLSPGFQSIIQQSSIKTAVQAVDTKQYTSWKDGYFLLQGSIPDILQQMSRWYDIEVSIQADVTDSLAMITFPRDVPLSTVLTAIQMASPELKYRIIKNDITSKNGATIPERRLTIFK